MQSAVISRETLYYVSHMFNNFKYLCCFAAAVVHMSMLLLYPSGLPKEVSFVCLPPHTLMLVFSVSSNLVPAQEPEVTSFALQKNSCLAVAGIA